MNNLSFAAIFLASFIGSGHCVGMCGGLAAFCGGTQQRSLTSSIAYHFGRILSYSVLGGVAGMFGKSINMLGESAGLQQTAIFLSGTILLTSGVFALLGHRRGSILSLSGLGFRGLLRVFSRPEFKSLSLVTRSGLLGLFSAALPCGWLWAFVILASGTGSFLAGAGVMAVFCIGSIPALAAVGGVSQMLTRRMHRLSPVVGALLLTAAGVLTLFQHNLKLGSFSSHLASASETAVVPAAPTCHSN